MRRVLPFLLLLLVPACPASDPDITPSPSPGVTSSPDPTPTAVPSDLAVRIVTTERIFESGTVIPFEVEATSSDPAPIEVELSSSVQGVITSGTHPASGTLTLDVTGLSLGWHDITVTARQTTDAGPAEASAVASVGICSRPDLIDFSTSPVGTGWEARGDAFWDSNGWLEITGNATNRSGSFFFTDRTIPPGDFEVEFSIATGGGPWCQWGDNTGADGFAVSVISAADVTDLNNILDTRSAGGCLGYGGSTPITGFHIEFDTFPNGSGDGCGAGSAVDPSPHHIAVTLDGLPRDHLLWADVPSLEDLQWRDIRIEVRGTGVIVEMDGINIIDGTIPSLQFEGGYIGITGSTGACTNFHRFDNLQLYDRCRVP